MIHQPWPRASMDASAQVGGLPGGDQDEDRQPALLPARCVKPVKLSSPASVKLAAPDGNVITDGGERATYSTQVSIVSVMTN